MGAGYDGERDRGAPGTPAAHAPGGPPAALESLQPPAPREPTPESFEAEARVRAALTTTAGELRELDREAARNGGLPDAGRYQRRALRSAQSRLYAELWAIRATRGNTT